MPILMPYRVFDSVRDLTLEQLAQLDIRGLIIDVDNTLTPPNAMQPSDGVTQWLCMLHQNDVRVVLLSNNSHTRVEPFAKKLGLPFLANALKPLPFGIHRALKLMQLPKSQVAVLGDQIFTDIAGANLSGIRGILVKPVHEKETAFFRFKRRLEQPAIDRYYRKKDV